MEPEKKFRVAQIVAILCVVYIWLVHLPMRIEHLRETTERRLAEVERRAQDGSSARAAALEAAHAELARRVGELDVKLKEVESNTANLSGSDLERLRGDLVVLRDDVSDIRRTIANGIGPATSMPALKPGTQGVAVGGQSSALEENAAAVVGGDAISTEGHVEGRERKRPTAAAPAAVTVEDWVIQPESASVKGDKLLVTLHVTNEKGERSFEIRVPAKAYDQLGREFPIDRVTIAEQDYAPQAGLRPFPEGLDTSVVLRFANADPRIDSVNSITLPFNIGANRTIRSAEVILKSIPLAP